MKLRAIFFTGVFVVLGARSGLADIPTIDAPQLDQHVATSQTKIKLLPVVTDHQTARAGVACATTNGQKGGVKDPTAAANPAAGAKAVGSYGPATPVVVDPSATGAALASQNEGAATAGVASGVAANQATITAGNGGFTALSGLVGTSATVMAAWDANTGARAQNGLTINGVIGAANLWAQALNIVNIASVFQSSQAANALSYPAPAAGACPVGMSGRGTSTNPCVTANSVCAAAIYGATRNPACVAQRTTDSYGNVVTYLAFVQNSNNVVTAGQINQALQALSLQTVGQPATGP